MCTGEALVSEQFLDDAQIRASIQQVCSKRMAKEMGVHIEQAGSLQQIFFEIALNRAGGKAASAQIQEDGSGIGGSAIATQQGATHSQIRLKLFLCLYPKRNQPLLLPLTPNFDQPLL